MASFKALCLAGVASFAVTAAASAADLPLPSPPPIYEPSAPVSTGGWYLRGDTGLAIAELRTRTSTYEGSVPDLRYENSSLDDSGFIDMGVGYRFNHYFRADVTGEYRGAAHYAANESYNIGAFAPDQYGNAAPNDARAYDNYGGSIRSIVGLVNGYVDVGTWWCVTPFFGAGVGVANVKVGSVTDISYGSGAANGQGNGGGGFSGSHSQTNFAFALMAGLDFAVTQNLTLEVGYRYLNLGNVSTGAIICSSASSCPYEVQHFKLASNDIRLGFRYAFSDITPLPPRAPIIARY